MNLSFFKDVCRKSFTVNEMLNLIYGALKVKDFLEEEYLDDNERIAEMKKYASGFTMRDSEYLAFIEKVLSLSYHQIAITVSECFGVSNTNYNDFCRFLFDQSGTGAYTLIWNAEKFAGDLYSFFLEHTLPEDLKLMLVCNNYYAYEILNLIFGKYRFPEHFPDTSNEFDGYVLLENEFNTKFQGRKEIGAIIADIPGYSYFNEAGKTIRLSYDKALFKFLDLPIIGSREMFFVLPRQFFTDNAAKDLRAFINSNYKICKMSFSNYNSVDKLNKTALLLLSDKSNGITNIVSETDEEKNFTTSELATLYADWGEAVFFSKDNICRTPLNNFAKVLRGRNLINPNTMSKKDVDPQNSCYVVGISDIDDYFLTTEKEHYCLIDENRIRPDLFLKNGDVLITNRGTQFKSVVFSEKENQKCVPSSSLLVIRTNPEILDPQFLNMFLRGLAATGDLQALSRTVGKINFSIEDIEKLEIPVPSFEQQNLCVEKYNSALKSLADAQKKVNECIEKIKAFEKEALS